MGRRHGVNVYVGDIGSTLASHVKFTGQATISPAGPQAMCFISRPLARTIRSRRMKIATMVPNALTNPVNGVSVLQSYWFIKSDHLGKVGIGKQSTASDNAAILVDGSGSLVPANWVGFDIAGFTGSGGAGINFSEYNACREGGVFGDCFGVPYNSVRYDSPTFGGFSFSASWGEDDIWDVAARYVANTAASSWQRLLRTRSRQTSTTRLG